MKKWKKLNKLSHKVLRELLLKLRVQPLVDLKRRHQRKRPFLEDSQQIREKGLLLLESNLAANLLQRENQLHLKRLDNHCLLLKRRNFKTQRVKQMSQRKTLYLQEVAQASLNQLTLVRTTLLKCKSNNNSLPNNIKMKRRIKRWKKPKKKLRNMKIINLYKIKMSKIKAMKATKKRKLSQILSQI